MRVTINHKIKAVQFWCHENEYDTTELHSNIERIFDSLLLDSKYKKVIYRAGTGDITDETIDLLKQNISIAYS